MEYGVVRLTEVMLQIKNIPGVKVYMFLRRYHHSTCFYYAGTPCFSS